MNDLLFGENPYLGEEESWELPIGTRGVLYILTNPAMPGLVKIGITTREVWDRIDELSRATGVPVPFEFNNLFRVRDVTLAERLAHYELRDFRIQGKEFFHCNPRYAYYRLEGLLNGSNLRIKKGDKDWPTGPDGKPIGFNEDDAP